MCPQKFTATLVIVDVFLLLFSYKSGYCKNLYVNTYMCFKHSCAYHSGHKTVILFQKAMVGPFWSCASTKEAAINLNLVLAATLLFSPHFSSYVLVESYYIYIYSLSGFFCWTLCFRDSSRFVHISLIHFHWMCNPSIWMHHNFSIHSITDRRFHYF